jgi:tetratricopeptide (TPR) repeat protein
MKKRIMILLTILASLNLIVLCNAESTEYMDLKWEYSTDSAVVFVHVDDLDNDGSKEVIAIASKETMSGAAGWIYVLNEEGSLKWTYPLPGSISAILIDDLDKDGKKDIIVGVFSYAHVLDGNGNLTWSSKTDYRRNILSLFAGDLDNDGSKELVIGTGRSYKATGELFIINEKGGHEWENRRLNGRANAVYAVDLDKDGFKEIIVGTVGKYGNREYPGYLQVFNTTGDEIWRYQTKKGILSLSVYDINGDGWDEILVGCQEYFYVLDKHGEAKGNSTTGGRIRDIIVTDLENDGVKEIILGSNEVYALDKNFKRKWINKVGTEVYDLDVADLDGDGDLEVIVASDKLYILDKEGNDVWQYSTKAVNSVYNSDLNGDGYPELVLGSVNGKIYVLHSRTYVERQDATRFYAKANELYSSGNYEEAKENAENAKKLYSKLEMYDGVKKCKELLDKIMNDENRVTKEKESAKEYYEKAHNAYLAGEYINATSYAQKAKYKYISFSDMENVDKCREIINKSDEFLRLDADIHLENASRYFGEGDYEKALFHAEKAREFYEFIKDDGAVNKSMELIAEINESLGKTEEAPVDNNELVTYILMGLIILAIIILVALIIKTRGGRNKEKPKPKVEEEKPTMKVKRKEDKPETRVKERKKTKKKRVKRKPVAKIAKDSIRGEGSSLRSLMDNNELKEV